MRKQDVTCVRSTLSERDLGILKSVQAHRLLTTAHIRRLHFPSGGQTEENPLQAKRHATEAAASAAAIRVLDRLKEHGLVSRLHRRIGGVRSGSTGIIWQLGAAGERLLRQGNSESKRRRYLEPSAAFTFHTLATVELAVQLHELAAARTIELLTLETEPDCWRAYVGPHGTKQWLKPDLFAVTASGEYEDHWFLEADCATEHTPVIIRKAALYQQYAATGAYQSEHGIFPVAVWVVPDGRRKETIEAALKADRATREKFTAGALRVVTVEGFSGLVTGGGG